MSPRSKMFPIVSIKPVTGEAGAMVLRRVYNAAMGPDEKVSAEAQKAWWEDIVLLSPGVEQTDAYVIWSEAGEGPEAIGYGLIVTGAEREHSRVSGAIVPECRGHGWGRALFSFLAAAAPARPWLSVRRDNLTAFNLYLKLGYVVVDAEEDTWIMEKYMWRGSAQ